MRVRIAGEERWVAIEDAGRLRDALGTALPVGLPEAFPEPVADPLGDLVARYARTHGPFLPAEVAARSGLGRRVVDGALARLDRGRPGRHGEFRPGGSGPSGATPRCCAAAPALARRAAREVEPVPAGTLARFLPAWQGSAAGCAASTACSPPSSSCRARWCRPRAGVAGAAGAGRRLLPRAARRADRRR